MAKNKIGIALFSFILLLLGGAILVFASFNGSVFETIASCKGWFFAMPVFFVLMCFAHIYESNGKNLKDYFKVLLEGTMPKEKRTVSLDYVRVLATLCILATHACSLQREEAVAAWKTGFLSVFAAYGHIGNTLYIMLSGALLLASTKEESLGKFYFGRFKRVVIPFAVYYFVLMVFGKVVDITSFSSILGGLKQILRGPSDVAPQYWILYIFISLYITAPFIKKMVQNLDAKGIKGLFWVIIVSEMIVNYLPLTGIELGLSFELAGWVGVFILGYIATSRRDALNEKAMYVIGFICLVILLVASVVNYSLVNYMLNAAPVSVLHSMALLMLFSKAEAKLKKRNNTVISILSQYSYAIILVHWQGLFAITMGRFPIQPLRFGCIGGIFATVFVATIVCFVLGFVGDNTVVISTRFLFSIPKAVKGIKKNG